MHRAKEGKQYFIKEGLKFEHRGNFAVLASEAGITEVPERCWGELSLAAKNAQPMLPVPLGTDVINLSFGGSIAGTSHEVNRKSIHSPGTFSHFVVTRPTDKVKNIEF